MGFQDNIPGVHIRAFNQIAAPAVYTDTDLNETPCNIILDHDVILQPSSYDAQVVEPGSTIEALYSDVGEPEKGATFVIDDTTYTVQRITDNDKVFVTMVVKDGTA